ncbi:hypothetical protein FGO68_gene14032 [Halteria grandinella]|uniref:Uncharacterized protein n=1 Tax=Halteria grandinella TaxID=5974 RepID=A0A8J8NX46_HALGN|nr:hypothetical protein FGO68_gene14032 [Halteria grandinella]
MFLKAVSSCCQKGNVKLINLISIQSSAQQLDFDEELMSYFSKFQLDMDYIEYNKIFNWNIHKLTILANGRSKREAILCGTFQEIIDYLMQYELQFENLQITQVKEVPLFPKLHEQKKVKRLILTNYCDQKSFLYTYQFIKYFPRLQKLTLFFSNVNSQYEAFSTGQFNHLKTKHIQQQETQEIIRWTMNINLQLPQFQQLQIIGSMNENFLKLGVIMRTCKNTLQELCLSGIDAESIHLCKEHQKVFATSLTKLHKLQLVVLDISSLALFGHSIFQLSQLQKLCILNSEHNICSLDIIEKARSFTNQALERLTNLKTFSLKNQILLPLSVLQTNYLQNLKCLKLEFGTFSKEIRENIIQIARIQKEGFKIKTKYCPNYQSQEDDEREYYQIMLFKDEFKMTCPGIYLGFKMPNCLYY